MQTFLKIKEMSTAQFVNARPEDLPQLLSLWLEAFGQKEEPFAKRFFSTLFSCDGCFVAREGEEILSAAYALEYEALLDQTPHRVAYLYAAATKKEHRGKGVFAALHRRIKEELTHRGLELLFLIPQTQELFDFWQKKMGYHTLFYRSGFYVPSLPESFVPTDRDLRLLYRIYRICRETAPGFRILEDFPSFCLTMEDKKVAVDVSSHRAEGYVIYTRRGEGYIIHDYPALGKKKLCGAGRTVRSAPAMPLGDSDLFERLYKTKPRLNFLLN